MAVYRVLISLFAVVTLITALRRGGLRAARARLGGGQVPDAPARVWLHGASNGELASMLPLLKALHESRPDLHWLITSNSDTAQTMLHDWQLDRVSIRPAPVDLSWVSARMMRNWRIVALMSLEAEFWPHRIRHCPGPVMQLGARMSARTARGWQRLPSFAARVFGKLDLVSAQDQDSQQRLKALGVTKDAAASVLDLKSLYTPPHLPPDPQLDGAFPRETTWLAASTHEGEDDMVLDAHVRLLQVAPDTRLILAPRHPRRAEAIAELGRARGLSVARRSANEPPETAQLYLADTMGEMARWYACAGRVFVGGSLVDRGGHTPYEPAAFSAAILHGPHVRNFAPSFDRLGTAKAAVLVQDAASLAQALSDLRSAAAQTRLGGLAHQSLAADRQKTGVLQQVSDLLPHVRET